VSALYVTGDKAKENFAVLQPFLEIDERLKNFDEIQENVKRRKLSINLEELMDEYKLFKAVEDRKRELENRRVEIAKLMREAASENLKLEGKVLRDDLKKLKENSYQLEDLFVHNFLNLPNSIHKSTPCEEIKIVYKFLEPPKSYELSDQMDNFIEFYDPTCYYMKNEAAKFDVFTPLNVSDYYQKEGYIKFSNPDFVRSIVPEIASLPQDNLFLLKEEDVENKLNQLHLSGNASFLSFLPFIAKLTSFASQFPLKLISTGKIYNGLNNYNHQDLYNLVQSTCCQAFIATCDESNFDHIIDEQVDNFKKIYEPFNQHFRIVYYPSQMLQPAESFKLGVEMFSFVHEKYIQVGNFSYYGDFISKRLLFNYKDGKEIKFPHIYTGTVMNVMRVLVNLLETNKNFKCS
jgi:seryl-tRNA synthetase